MRFTHIPTQYMFTQYTKSQTNALTSEWKKNQSEKETDENVSVRMSFTMLQNACGSSSSSNIVTNKLDDFNLKIARKMCVFCAHKCLACCVISFSFLFRFVFASIECGRHETLSGTRSQYAVSHLAYTHCPLPYSILFGARARAMCVCSCIVCTMHQSRKRNLTPLIDFWAHNIQKFVLLLMVHYIAVVLVVVVDAVAIVSAIVILPIDTLLFRFISL